jgi:hypothetical protein
MVIDGSEGGEVLVGWMEWMDGMDQKRKLVLFCMSMGWVGHKGGGYELDGWGKALHIGVKKGIEVLGDG